MLYDRGDQHYEMISALHKSIRASDDNAALYWCTRMMVGVDDYLQLRFQYGSTVHSELII